MMVHALTHGDSVTATQIVQTDRTNTTAQVNRVNRYIDKGGGRKADMTAYHVIPNRCTNAQCTLNFNFNVKF